MPPKVKIERREKYDLDSEEWVKDILPTTTVRDAERSSGNVEDSTLTSHYIGAGSVMLLTFHRVAANGSCEWALTDRDGTVDIVLLEAAGDEVLLGRYEAPIHVVKGTFQVILLGSYGAGTYISAWEGVAERRKPTTGSYY